MKAWTRWQDWVSLVLGVLLFISPWVFAAATGASGWDPWIVGIIGVILALIALGALAATTAVEVISVILGVWLFISPWVLGFATTHTGEAWVAWILGVLFVIVNGWSLLQGRERVGAPA